MRIDLFQLFESVVLKYRLKHETDPLSDGGLVVTVEWTLEHFLRLRLQGEDQKTYSWT